MLGTVFYWVLNMSITAVIVGFVVLLLRCIRKIPRRVLFFFWIFPLIRFWLPIGFGSHYSLMNLLNGVIFKQVVVYKGVNEPMLSFSNYIQAAQSYDPMIYKTNLLEQLFFIASIVWLIVAAAAILTVTALYLLTKSELKDAKKIEGQLYSTEKILSPAVFGIFYPKIILPAGQLGEKTLSFVVLHEKMHIQRKDNLWRVIAVITCCLHWFNPFVWLFLKCFFEDMELSCDEKVLSKCGEDKKKEYALALLAVEEEKTLFASAFGGAKTRVRIAKILSYRKLTAFSAVCFVILTLAAAVVLLTNTA